MRKCPVFIKLFTHTQSDIARYAFCKINRLNVSLSGNKATSDEVFATIKQPLTFRICTLTDSLIDGG